jgi:site-specific DNA recombinase
MVDHFPIFIDEDLFAAGSASPRCPDADLHWWKKEAGARTFRFIGIHVAGGAGQERSLVMHQSSTFDRPVRCAIYTRKSFQPPIAQEITSLESQRSICSSYIVSQQHRNWVELERHYDDAGKSGATLDRPALAALLDDIEQGQVDVVLVYKMDRITRTLLDFVRLLDLFERFGVELVAITQNFDTSDSMGRLIRNVLLTFAQFEREIASDRMRDKKMVMKQRGRWTGGGPPIGYNLNRGKLVVNKTEASAVRCIYETYLATGSLSATHRTLLNLGFRRSTGRRRNGQVKKAVPIGLPSLYHILKNPTYIGDVTYRGERYKGIHEAIIEIDLWEKVQAILAARKPHAPFVHQHMLTGLIFDAHGRRMNAQRKFNELRYYVSSFAKWAIDKKIKRMTVRSDEIERQILVAILQLLRDRPTLRVHLLRAGFSAGHADRLAALDSSAAVRLERFSASALRPVVRQLLARVEVAYDCVRLLIRLRVVSLFIEWTGIGTFRVDDMGTQRSRPYIPVEPRRDNGCKASPALVRLLSEAKDAQELIYEHRELPFLDIARLTRFRPAMFGRLVRLNYLAPDIVAAIHDGTQPASLTRTRLMHFDLPIDWRLQRTLLGFDEKPELTATPPPRPIC